VYIFEPLWQLWSAQLVGVRHAGHVSTIAEME